jgi:hypothetical protein
MYLILISPISVAKAGIPQQSPKCGLEREQPKKLWPPTQVPVEAGEQKIAQQPGEPVSRNVQ